MNLRVFVSSTCYDLSIIRSQLKSFLENMGYDAILSEYNDIFYDPNDHTHVSCVKEIANADLVILIIGSRYGGVAIQELKKFIDFNKLINLSRNSEYVINNKEQLSITQYEILKAIESDIPVYCFVEDAVWHDHLVYEQNKDNEDVIKAMKFPSIDKNEAAPYIFEFINFMRTRIHNNAVFQFAKLEDIESTLVKQWSNLFQNLLFERRKKSKAIGQINEISTRLDDMKALIMSSMNNNDDKSKTVAKGVLKYRQMINYVSCFIPTTQSNLILERLSWNSLLKKCGIKGTKEFKNEKLQNRLAIVRDDNTFYLHRISFFDDYYTTSEKLWDEFYRMDKEAKSIIVEAVRDSSNQSISDLRLYEQNIEDYIEQIQTNNNKSNEDENMPF